MKQLLLLVAVSLILTSCYKTQGPDYYDQLDITLTKYDVNFNFAATKSVYVKDSVVLRHDYLTDSQVKDFYSRGGASDKIVNEIKQQFISKGYQVNDSRENDSLLQKTADLYINPTVMLSKTTDVYYYPGYGWGWGWGFGWYGYYSVDPSISMVNQDVAQDQSLINKSANYYDPYYPYYPYYPPYWGGGYMSSTYKTGTVVLEMAEGESVRDYWEWYKGKSHDDIYDTPQDSLPQVTFVWHAFMESVISDDQSYDNSRFQRAFDEAFKQSYYFNK